jgi:uncharacterized phiE125 gp8 family phage protein
VVGNYKIKTQPTEEPISLSEIKTHLKLDGSDEDTYLGLLGKSARQYLEAWLDRAICTTEYELYLDAFEDIIEVRKGCNAVTDLKYLVSASYTTLVNTEYVVDTVTPIGRIVPVTSWPGADDRINAIKITFNAGFGAASAVPNEIKHALLLMVGRAYEQREDSVERLPKASEQLAKFHKLYA